MYTWVQAQLTTNGKEALQRTWKLINQFFYSPITVFWTVTPFALVGMYFVGSSLWTAGCHILGDSNVIFLQFSVVLDAILDKIAYGL
jgi:hypothetical protein